MMRVRLWLIDSVVRATIVIALTLWACALLSLFVWLVIQAKLAFVAAVSTAPLLLLIMPPALCVIVWLLRRYARPADGAGFIDIDTALTARHSNTDDVLSWQTGLGRCLLTPLTALVGGIVGFFGPALHMVVALSAGLSRAARITTPMMGAVMLMVVCVVLLHAPLAAMVMTPVWVADWRQRWVTWSMQIIALFVVWRWQILFADWSWSLSILPLSVERLTPLLLLCLIGGLAGLLFRKICQVVSSLAMRQPYLVAFVCGVILALLTWWYGGDLQQRLVEPIPLDATLPLALWFGSVVTVASGASAGLVIPLLTVGGDAAQFLSLPAAVGAAALLAGVVRYPLFVALLTAEYFSAGTVAETLAVAIIVWTGAFALPRYAAQWHSRV